MFDKLLLWLIFQCFDKLHLLTNPEDCGTKSYCVDMCRLLQLIWCSNIGDCSIFVRKSKHQCQVHPIIDMNLPRLIGLMNCNEFFEFAPEILADPPRNRRRLEMPGGGRCRHGPTAVPRWRRHGGAPSKWANTATPPRAVLQLRLKETETGHVWVSGSST